jgi:hypothetical protein
VKGKRKSQPRILTETRFTLSLTKRRDNMDDELHITCQYIKRYYF